MVGARPDCTRLAVFWQAIVFAAETLFARDSLEDGPTLKAIKQLLDTLPHEKLLVSLQAAHGRGRDDYPVRRRRKPYRLASLISAHPRQLQRNRLTPA